MRRILLPFTLAALALAFTAPLAASEVDHYSGKKAENLEQAVTNLREYNARLDAIVARDDLSPADLAKVHKLTYTIENALKRIQTELGTMAGDLETVHLASERQEAETVRKHGKAFLEQARTLTGE